MPQTIHASDSDLIDALIAADGHHTHSELGSRIQRSPEEVRSGIERMQHAGCDFDRHPRLGVRLVSTGLGCWADHIELKHPNGIGRRVTVFQQTTSTQSVARQMVTSGGDHNGHVIVADYQSRGKGRLGRHWNAEPGASLLLTVIFDCRCDHDSRHAQTVDRLMLASCCAVADTVESLTSRPAQVRWPNDVLIEGRKVCGILIDKVDSTALIGIGINVHASPSTSTSSPGSACRHQDPTCLSDWAPPRDRLGVLDRLLAQLDHALIHTSDDELSGDWRRRSCLINQRVTLQADGTRLTGRLVDIDPRDGVLVLDDRGVLHTLAAATTSVVGV